MAEIILSTLAKLMECKPEQISEALQTSKANITLEQLLAYHSALCDIIIRDLDGAKGLEEQWYLAVAQEMGVEF